MHRFSYVEELIERLDSHFSILCTTSQISSPSPTYFEYQKLWKDSKNIYNWYLITLLKHIPLHQSINLDYFGRLWYIFRDHNYLSYLWSGRYAILLCLIFSSRVLRAEIISRITELKFHFLLPVLEQFYILIEINFCSYNFSKSQSVWSFHF